MRRSPGGLLGHLLETRYGAAEGALACVAVMLVVWMLWPEASGPQLAQRTTRQQSVEETERRRLSQDTERAGDSEAEASLPVSEVSRYGDRPGGIVSHSDQTSRSRIARPSELADRLDKFGRRPGERLSARSFQPGPKRPPRSDDPAIGTEILLQADQGGTGVASDEVNTALTDEEGEGPVFGSSPEGLPLEVAGLSNLPPDTEPLPEVDLSDLDILVPEKNTTSLPVAAIDAELPAAAIAPPPDADIASLVAEPDLGAPLADVKERPRDDAPSWLKNAVTAAVDDERPIIAVVIDDLGLNRASTAELNSLPSPLTLAFLPYAGRIDAQTEAAQAAGHELMLHLPMEPIGSDWPGPDALTTKLDQQEFVARLEKNLDRFRGFVGINNHMGSKLTADGSRMDVIMRELRRRDVLFLDSKTSARSVAGEIAGQNGVPNTTRDVFLDHVIDLGAIKRQLALTEKIARRTGSAVAIGHPHSSTIQALREWLPSLTSRGFALAPISAVVARRACSSGVLIAPQTCGRYLQAQSPAEPAIAAKDG